ncbi:hypothetical protein, partial [Escherichia coli]|uniref:hypothetical protein n=1 Tax=Escherichia coli TaxID=562 RepID=UPI001BC85021
LFKTASRSLLPVALPRVVILTPINHVRKRIALRTVKIKFALQRKSLLTLSHITGTVSISFMAP